MLSKARSAVRESLASLNPGDHVIVAVSGGADSLLLAHCLQLEKSELALSVTAVVIDHQLQAESAYVATAAKSALQKIGIERVEIITVDVVKKDGIEADARQARYAALNSFADKVSATAIFLGHNEDDLAESVLLGLTQGAGTKSLAGMATHDGRYIRPLLVLSREEVIAACAEAKIEYWSDPHNEDLRFTRVKIRKQVMPMLESELGPGIKSALARSARIFREDSDALDRLTDEILPPLQIPPPLRLRCWSACLPRCVSGSSAALPRTLAPLASPLNTWVGSMPSSANGMGKAKSRSPLVLQRGESRAD